MFRFIRAWFSPAKADGIVREEVETDERGCPKVSALTKPLEYYIRLYEQSFQLTKELPVAKPGHRGGTGIRVRSAMRTTTGWWLRGV